MKIRETDLSESQRVREPESPSHHLVYPFLARSPLEIFFPAPSFQANPLLLCISSAHDTRVFMATKFGVWLFGHVDLQDQVTS